MLLCYRQGRYASFPSRCFALEAQLQNIRDQWNRARTKLLKWLLILLLLGSRTRLWRTRRARVEDFSMTHYAKDFSGSPELDIKNSMFKRKIVHHVHVFVERHGGIF